MSYDEDSVGALMDFEAVTVREDVTLEAVLRYLRRFDELPDHTDQLFVVDRDERLQGRAALNLLLVNDPTRWSPNVMPPEPLTLSRTRRPDGGAGLRALRPGVGAGGRQGPQAGRPRDGERGGGLHPRIDRDGPAPAPACARARTSSPRCGIR
jgi:hypothetical protein